MFRWILNACVFLAAVVVAVALLAGCGSSAPSNAELIKEMGPPAKANNPESAAPHADNPREQALGGAKPGGMKPGGG